MKKTRYIWSNLHHKAYPNKEENLEAYREFLEILYEGTNKQIPDEIEDSDLDEYIDNCINENLSILVSEIRHYERTHGEKEYVVVADLGLWNGRQAGGKIIKGLSSAIRRTFEDYNTVEMKGNRLTTTCTHHDGTNFFEIKELTPRGVTFKNHNWCNLTEKELHHKLFTDSHYSREVTMFKEIYGW